MKKIENTILEMGDGVKDVGHIKSWFIKNSKELIAFHTPQTFLEKACYFERYNNSKLIEKKYFFLYKGTSKILKYIFSLLYFYFIVLLHAKKNTYIIVLNPIYMLFSSIIQYAKKCNYVLWVWDYFGDRSNIFIFTYNLLIKHYINSNKITIFLSDNLKKIYTDEKRHLNNQVISIGTNIKKYKKLETGLKDKIIVGYIGIIKKGQNIENILNVLKNNKNIYFEIIGSSSDLKSYIEMAKLFGVDQQVHFFGYVAQNKIRHITQKWVAGIALYENSIDNLVKYTDSGKIKLYLELGLPILATKYNTLYKEIIEYDAGKIIQNNSIKEIESSILLIKDNFEKYSKNSLRLANKYNYLKIYQPFKKIFVYKY